MLDDRSPRPRGRLPRPPGWQALLGALALAASASAATPPSLPDDSPDPIAAGKVPRAMRVLRAAALHDGDFGLAPFFEALEEDLYERQWSPVDPEERYTAIGLEVELRDIEASEESLTFPARGAAILLDGPAIRWDSDEVFYEYCRLDQQGGVTVAGPTEDRLLGGYFDYGVSPFALDDRAEEPVPRLLRRLRRKLWWSRAELAGPVRIVLVGRGMEGPYPWEAWVLRARLRTRSGAVKPVAFVRREPW